MQEQKPRVHIDAPADKLRRLRELQKVAAERERILVIEDRKALLEQAPHPALLAKKFDPNYVITPAVELVSKALADTVTGRAGRQVVSVPPQEMKTSLLRWMCFWTLVQNPDCRIVFSSYAEDLARQSGRIVRSYVEGYGPSVGLDTDKSHRDAAEWSLAHGYQGNMTSVGVGGGLTGKPCDFLIIDDPVRNQADADSVTVRNNLMEWWQAVARLRLAPSAPVIVVQTRWKEDDLAGTLIDQGWPYINIPALADGKTEDALDRPPGTYLESTRGRTPQDWEDIRADVGERTWAALLQGRPAPVEGGIFQASWFRDHRVKLDDMPDDLVEIAVGIDPAETGTGDAAGILVAGRGKNRHLYVLADLSGQLTQAQWARKACFAWIEHGASRIIQERNLGMRNSIPDAWSIIRRQARALQSSDSSADALQLLIDGGDEQAANLPQLEEVAPHIEDVLDRNSSGPRVESVTPKQSKMVRAQSVTGLFETGKAHMVGRHSALEHECCVWQPGQASPNRIDVMAMLLTRLDQAHMSGSIKRGGRHLVSVPTATVTTLAR